jgi:hypothetical protein
MEFYETWHEHQATEDHTIFVLFLTSYKHGDTTNFWSESNINTT